MYKKNKNLCQQYNETGETSFSSMKLKTCRNKANNSKYLKSCLAHTLLRPVFLTYKDTDAMDAYFGVTNTNNGVLF